MNDLTNILEKIDYLPPFPATVAKALREIKNPNATPEEIAGLIRFDQAIATNVLKLCNSGYFGLSRKVTSISEALVYIGLSELRKMLVLSGVRGFYNKKHVGYEAHSGELWQHSLAASIIAENLKKKIDCVTDDSVFIAALLHDIGKLVLGEFVESYEQQIGEMIDRDGVTFIEAEQAVFSIDHAELGARILDRWEFPDDIVSAVRKHHAINLSEDSDLEKTVSLSDTLAMMMGYGTAIDGLAYKGFAEICQQYCLGHADIDSILDKSLSEIENIIEEYGFIKEEK